MPSLEELEMDPASEAAFRRGFFPRGTDCLNVVRGSGLNEADRRKLKEWMRIRCLEWRGPARHREI